MFDSNVYLIHTAFLSTDLHEVYSQSQSLGKVMEMQVESRDERRHELEELREAPDL